MASSGRLVATNCAPLAAVGDTIYYNRRDAAGLLDGYTCHISQIGTGSKILPDYDGHRGVTDVTPDGRYVLFETAVGTNRKLDIAENGKGVNNDIQLLDRQTGQLRTLVSARSGTIWAQIRNDGKRIMWAEMEKPSDLWNHLLGVWSLHVADVTDTGIANEREYQHPTEPGFIETYGWLPDGRIVYASDSGARGSFMWWLGAQLWTLPDDLSGPAQRYSPPFKDKTWCYGYSWCTKWYDETSPYHEFAHVKDGWLYTSIIRDTKSNGMDLWRYRLDDTSVRERVTWFGGNKGVTVPGWPEARYMVVGSLAFLPDGTILAALSADANSKVMDAYLIVP